MPTKSASTKSSKKPTAESSKKVSKKTAKAPRKARPKATTVAATPRHEMIEKAAYYRAERRNFENGDAVADWLSGEKEIEVLLSHGNT
jgi:hypothetical protein